MVPYWRMESGAEFYLAIPDGGDIHENGFSPEVEFPFAFDEVVSLTIRPLVGPPRLQIKNDLDAARRAVSCTDGLTCREQRGELVVSPAESPRHVRAGVSRQNAEGETAA
jgi:hypothetical protein